MNESITILIVVSVIAFYYWILWDISRSVFKKPDVRSTWYLVVLLLPVFGSIFWFVLRKEMTVRKK